MRAPSVPSRKPLRRRQCSGCALWRSGQNASQVIEEATAPGKADQMAVNTFWPAHFRWGRLSGPARLARAYTRIRRTRSNPEHFVF